MKNQKIRDYAVWIIFTEIIGIIAGLLTSRSAEIYSQTVLKPPLSPPSVLFPIVWTVLYALMGIGIARVRAKSTGKESDFSLSIYLLQLFFNFAWSFIFFSFAAFGFAFFWLIALWILILIMTVCFGKADRLSALIQIPYLLWVLFAGYLNLGVWVLN